MATAYENLKKSLEKAIFYLKSIKEAIQKFDEEELVELETKITDLITELVNQ